MKGDFSRSTFAARNHYRRVLMQQGRVEVDADSNEQIAIGDHIAATTGYDVIGPSGAPMVSLPDGTPAGGFAIAANAAGTDLTISRGRMYVGGLLVENDTDSATLLQQPDVPLAAGATLGSLGLAANSVYIVYLDVWERLITALDNPLIRETALGGPDTSVRARLVWQVKLALVQQAGGATPTCTSIGEPWLPPSPQGMLSALTVTDVNPVPCVLPPETGFRRLENQLYRVEIHTAGGYGTATFKWSRENGSVLAGILAPPGPTPPKTVQGPTFSVTSTGRDASLSFQAGDWVELTDDRSELLHGRGELLQVQVTPTNGTITTTAAATAAVDLALHPKLRRWDQSGAALGSGILIADGTPIELEDGVAVQFSNGQFNVGDYWLIPARTQTSIQEGHIEWPVDAANTPIPQPPRGITHQYAKLALVSFDGARLSVLEDCRLQFPPLTSLEPAPAALSPCTVVVAPVPDWEKRVLDVFAGHPAADAEVCFQVGTFATNGLVVKSAGNIKVTGAGLGTRIVARGTESALRFEGCASVEVSDLYAESSSVDAPDDQNRKRVNGTLEFANCADVVVENVALKCGAGTLRGAACITILNDITERNATTGSGSARVRGSRLIVGQMQFGILLVHVRRATVEDNQIDVERGFRLPSLGERLRDPHFLAAARRLLVSNASLTRVSARPSAASEAVQPAPAVSRVLGHPDVTVRVGNQTLTFATHGGLQATWQTFLDQHAPREFATQRDALNFVKSEAGRILTDPAARSQLAAFGDILRILELSQVLPAARGIVVAGRASEDVHVRDNRISGALQGIAIGASHRETSAGTPDRMHTVSVCGNTIEVDLTILARRHAREGIFVGNVDSLLVDNNRVVLTPEPGVGVFPSDGIRVWGYLGKRMIVRNNHVTRFPTGIRVVAQVGPGRIDTTRQQYETATRAGNQWLVADNAIEFSQLPIDAIACMQTGNII